MAKCAAHCSPWSLSPGTYDVVLGEGDAAERRQVVWPGRRREEVPPAGSPHNPAPSAAAASAIAVTSALSVITEPAGGAISIDGVDSAERRRSSWNIFPP